MEKREVLEAQIEELQHFIDAVTLENSVFQKFIENKTIELGEKDDENKKKKKIKKNIPKQLTMDQKMEIATVVHDDIISELDNERKKSEKMLDTLRAVIDESEIRINEIKRDAFEFKRDVVMLGSSSAVTTTTNNNNKDILNNTTTTMRNSTNGKSGVGMSTKPPTPTLPPSSSPTIVNNISKDKLIQEKLTRFLNDKTTQIDATVEKLKLKNIQLKIQIQKIEIQLSQKEDVGDTLHYIDFHQLQIENKQNIVKISEKNDELIQLKQSTAKTILILNDTKSSLNNQNEEMLWLTAEILTKEKTLEKLKLEKMRSRKSIHIQNQQLEKLQSQLQLLNVTSTAGQPTNTTLTIGNGDSSSKNNNNNNKDNDINSYNNNNNDDDDSITGTSTTSINSTAVLSIANSIPNIPEYMDQKRIMYECQEGIKNWQRKLEVMELAAKNLKII